MEDENKKLIDEFNKGVSYYADMSEMELTNCIKKINECSKKVLRDKTPGQFNERIPVYCDSEMSIAYSKLQEMSCGYNIKLIDYVLEDLKE